MKVRFEPVGIELDCGPGETVLDAAFRQGLNLAHGCREGQCSACKCFLLEGEVALKRHSSFALSESERASGYSLMCRALPESDLVVELLHFDPDTIELAHPIRDGEATVASLEPLTGEIVRLVLDAPGFTFTPGQYIDLHVPGDTESRRSFSMANLPDGTIELLIRRYEGGRISGMLGTTIRPGTTLAYTGPYGNLRLHDGDAPILMIAGGTGLAPILSLLRELATTDDTRPVRLLHGARTSGDLVMQDEVAELGRRLADFRCTPWTGRRFDQALDDHVLDGDALDGHVLDGDALDGDAVDGDALGARDGWDVYMCGPPAMLDAAEQALTGRGVDPRRIFQDRFTTSADVAPAGPPLTTRADAAPTGPRRTTSADAAPARPRRTTLYEEVTVDTQPSIHRHLVRGWSLSFEDGRGTWDDRSTALSSSDWFAFRDPAARWERDYYQEGAQLERQIEGAIRTAISQELFSDMDPAWVELMRSALQVPALIEHGLWFALATIGRDCLSDTVAHCVSLEAAMKQRSSQAIVLGAMDLEPYCGPLPTESAREAFLEEPEWQPARAYLEKLAGTHDWGEVIVAANLVWEPIVGTLLRRELGIRAASSRGDPVTPTIARAAAQEWEWTRAWSVELCRFLLADPHNGEANRARIEEWAAVWLPDALAAARGIAALAGAAGIGFDPDRALDRITLYAAGVLRDAGLPGLAGSLAAEPRGAAGGDRGQAVPIRRVRTPGVPGRGWAGVANRQSPPPVERSSDGRDAEDHVGIVIARSAEGDAIAAVLRGHPEVELLEQPAFWEARARGRLVIGYAELSERLGYEIDAYGVQRELSTHYGRMVAGDDALMLFADPTEAMGHLIT